MSDYIKVLYKKSGNPAKPKFITDMLTIKKHIINGNLKMVKFESCIIVCNKNSINANYTPNIILNFKNICGDLFLIGYDKNIKDFISLTDEEISFYEDVLNRKSFKWQNEKLNNQNIETNSYYKELAYKSNKAITKSNNDISNANNTMLGMILNIQAIILKHIKNMNGEQ